MQAILLNAKERTVKEVDISQSIDDIRRLIDCQCFTVGHWFDNGDVAYIDDEGLLVNPEHFVQLGDYTHQPLAGNVLIVGTGNEGESTDCKTSTTEIHDQIMWLDLPTAIVWAKAFSR